MSLQEFTLDQNTGLVPLAHEDNCVAQVKEIERQAHAEKCSIEEDAGGLEGAARGNPEADLLIDIGLEVIGVKGAATAAQLIGGRLEDTFESRNSARSTIEDEVKKAGRSAGTYTPSIGEDLIARANIATCSLDMDPKHVNTEKWGGTDTKMPGVSQARALNVCKEFTNKQVLDSVYAVERQHSAMLGRVNQMVPGLGMGSGPAINPKQLLSYAEDASDMEDWQRRLAEQVGTA